VVWFASSAIGCARSAIDEVVPREEAAESDEVRVTRNIGESVVPDFEPTSDVPIGVIRWDAAPSDPELRSAFGIGTALTTRYSYLEPLLGWYLYGSGVDTQSIVDTEIREDAGAIGHYAFVWYPPHELLDPDDDIYATSDIQHGFDAYMASQYRGAIKFALILQSFWLMTPRAGEDWGYLDTFAAWVRDRTKDPQYQTIDGLPLIYLYDSEEMPTDRWAEFTATVGPVYTVDVNHRSPDAHRLALQGLATYGPNGASLPGLGQRPWTAQRDIDRSHWGKVDIFDDVRSLTPLCDSRPRKGTAVTYGDQPTEPEWLDHLAGALSGDPKLVLIYARNEYDEAGGTTGTSYRDGTRFNDALRWARGAPRPDSYSYEIDAHSMVCARTGTWTYDFPAGGIPGAFESDEIVSGTVGDSRALAHPRMLGVTLFATRGPDRGVADVELDGVRVARVNLYASEQSRHVGVWNSGPLDGADHTVEVKVTGERDGRSSSAQIGLDSFGVKYAP
jgi:hypothetical protein